MAKKYNLTDTQIRHLAIICFREQGSNDAGVRACASHMCNYYERYQTKHFKDVYECTFGSGWYWEKSKNEKWVAEHPSVPDSVVSAVKDVIVNGNRTLPEYVDEYDCLSDVALIINDGVTHTMVREPDYVKNRANYHKDKTIIQNVYADSSADRYTFYCFPDGVNGYCDAFGYINKNAAQTTASSTAQTTVPVSRTTAKLPELRVGSYGAAVSVLQGLLGMMGYCGGNGRVLDIDGEFGANTAYALASYQKAAGIPPDGVCGPKTWQKLKNALKV